jgi:hypothetical protein
VRKRFPGNSFQILWETRTHSCVLPRHAYGYILGLLVFPPTHHTPAIGGCAAPFPISVRTCSWSLSCARPVIEDAAFLLSIPDESLRNARSLESLDSSGEKGTLLLPVLVFACALHVLPLLYPVGLSHPVCIPAAEEVSRMRQVCVPDGPAVRGRKPLPQDLFQV